MALDADHNSPSDRAQAIERVFERTPVAHVGAVRRDGVMTRLPDGLPLGPGHRAIESRTVIDLVTTESTAAVVATWERVRVTGHARCKARLRVDASALVEVEFFDLRPNYDVFLVLISSGEHGEERRRTRPGISLPISPRIGRLRKDSAATVLDADAQVLTMLGFEAHEMVGRRSLDLVHPDDQAVAIDNWLAMLSTPEHPHRVRLRHLQGDGTHRWVEISNENRIGADGEGDVITEMIDIGQEMAMLELLREREQLLSRLAEALPLALLHFDLDGTIVYANERVAEITGVEAGPNLESQLDRVVAVDRAALLDAARSTLVTGVPTAAEVSLELDGRRWVCDVRVRAIQDPDGEVSGAIMCISDVTESVALRQELHERATYDSLTGCLNRTSTIDALERLLQDAAVGVAVAFVDLEGFKSINDAHGHALGDSVLAAVGRRLQRAARHGDLVGRIGGDEFLVISSPVPSSEETASIVARVREAIDHELSHRDAIVAVRATVGGAWTDETVDAGVLVARADDAMYRNKRAGSNDRPAPIASRRRH